jgi:hypothetical protein
MFHAQTATVTSPHIITLPENTDGEDIIIGDVHGNASLLKIVISQLDDEDRLIIVGDLMDKGPESLAVINLVREHRPNGGKLPTIHLVQGNHEHFFLEYARLVFAGKKTDSLAWWLNHPGHQWVTGLSPEDLKVSYDFISQLPYILHVKGAKPFNVVHADMPFDDEKMQEKITKDERLTLDEIMHAVITREEMKVFIHRKPGSYLTYCGHTPVAGTHPNMTGRIVRQEAETINLDVLAYFNYCFLGVRHKKSEAFLVGTVSENLKPRYEEMVETVNAYLKPNQYLQCVMNQIQLLLKQSIEAVNKQACEPDPNIKKLIVVLTQAYPYLVNFEKSGMTQPRFLQSARGLITVATQLLNMPFWNIFHFFSASNSFASSTILPIQKIEKSLAIIEKLSSSAMEPACLSVSAVAP